ncbi:MAG: hypothetical protein CMO32_22705 [Variovorax sp.]|nr:hypothetical protein [Variovorax sp.]
MYLLIETFDNCIAQPARVSLPWRVAMSRLRCVTFLPHKSSCGSLRHLLAICHMGCSYSLSHGEDLTGCTTM